MMQLLVLGVACLTIPVTYLMHRLRRSFVYCANLDCREQYTYGNFSHDIKRTVRRVGHVQLL